MKDEIILLAHGSGGTLMHDLIKKLIVPVVGREKLAQLDDAAELEIQGARIAFTTDSYTVTPPFFKGGNIGKLAVAGTVNDLVMKGAIPVAISLALIIEEGLQLAELEKILESIAITANEAGVEIVTGDTKVVEKGSADKLFINTAGVGFIPEGRNVSGANAKPGDVVIVSGTIGDHGIAVINERENLGLNIPVESDVQPLNDLVEHLFAAVPPPSIHVLRDPTRGGLATTLNEIASQSQVVIRIEEEKIPIKEQVRGACEILGYDPLYVANEGKMIVIVDEESADKALAALKEHEKGKDAAIIGWVEKVETKPAVFVKTVLGTSRFLTMLAGEQFPRIC
jgi:hydrogenase expression/formation protein HypE